MLITNLTDAPGHPKGPTGVDIYNKTISPGANLKIPADLVNKKIRALEQSGLISIGNLPPWYVTAKRRSKPLSDEEKQKRLVVAPPPAPPKVKPPEKNTKKPELEEPAAKKE